MNKFNFKLLIPLSMFLILTIPFLNVLPYMDGNIDFVQVFDFYKGGFNQYFNNWNTVHPPFKLLLIYPVFSIFGPSQYIYNIIGIIFGVIGIASIYLLTKKITNERTAFLAAIFLSIYPLFIANSIFVMRDLMLTSLIILSLYFYSSKKYFLYSISISLSVLTKETGLLLPLIIIAIEIFFLFKNKFIINKAILIKLSFLVIPLLVYYFWKYYLSVNRKNSWSEWIFTNNENKSAIYTIFNNISTFNFLNPYAQAHLKQLLFLNFNWIYILIIINLVLLYILKKKFKHNLKPEIYKTIIVIILFVIAYCLSVLTLQTYTIPRYALPIIPFIIIGLAKSIDSIKNKLIFRFTSILIFILMITSLFSSVDPVAKNLWGINDIFNHKIYALNDHMAGNDGITYNLQYLLIAKERSDLIKKSNNTENLISNYCRWIFPDPNNERLMFNALKINSNFSCNQF